MQRIVRLRPREVYRSSPTELMNQMIPSRKMRDLAQRLLAYEAAALNSSEHDTPAVSRVSEKLRGSLTTLAGATGFRTLLARALTLAKKHAPGTPGINAIQVRPDGSLAGLNELHDNGEIAEAGVLLIAQLLGLLVLFIGENLVLRLALDIWPDLSVVDPELQKESET